MNAMADVSELEERLRRLEESHNALALRVEKLDSPKGALKIVRRAESARLLPELLFGLATLVAVVWFVNRYLT